MNKKKEKNSFAKKIFGEERYEKLYGKDRKENIDKMNDKFKAKKRRESTKDGA